MANCVHLSVFPIGLPLSYWLISVLLMIRFSAMEAIITTVSSKGQLVIPAKMREALGIKTGTRVSIALKGNELILRPSTELVAQQLIAELSGMTGGGESMADELNEDRRSEGAGEAW